MHPSPDGAAYPDAFAQNIQAVALDKDLHISYIGKFRNRIDNLPELAYVSIHTVGVIQKVFVKVDIGRFSPDCDGKNLGVRRDERNNAPASFVFAGPVNKGVEHIRHGSIGNRKAAVHPAPEYDAAPVNLDEIEGSFPQFGWRGGKGRLGCGLFCRGGRWGQILRRNRCGLCRYNYNIWRRNRHGSIFTGHSFVPYNLNAAADGFAVKKEKAINNNNKSQPEKYGPVSSQTPSWIFLGPASLGGIGSVSCRGLFLTGLITRSHGFMIKLKQ